LDTSSWPATTVLNVAILRMTWLVTCLYKTFNRIPSFVISDKNHPVEDTEILEKFLQTRSQLQCGNEIATADFMGGMWSSRRGVSTVLLIIRLNQVNNWRIIVRTRLSDIRTRHRGHQYLGEMINVVSQCQSSRQHYVSYHRVNNNWHLNDDQ